MSAEWKVGVEGTGPLVVWDGEYWRWADTGTLYSHQPPVDLRPLVLIGDAWRYYDDISAVEVLSAGVES